MGFSLIAQGAPWQYLPDASWRPLIARLGYTVGCIIVVLGRQPLFTENTRTRMISLFSHGGTARLLNVARLRAVVRSANLVGTPIIAWLVGHTQVFVPPVRAAFTEVSRTPVEGDPGAILLRGIFAGWLIALMVWLLPFAETARVTIIIIVTYVVALDGFTHVIAGSVEACYLVTSGAISIAQAVLGYMLPTLVGNVIGGIALVAAPNHAQVVAGRDA